MELSQFAQTTADSDVATQSATLMLAVAGAVAVQDQELVERMISSSICPGSQPPGTVSVSVASQTYQSSASFREEDDFILAVPTLLQSTVI